MLHVLVFVHRRLSSIVLAFSAATYILGEGKIVHSNFMPAVFFKAWDTYCDRISNFA